MAALVKNLRETLSRVRGALMRRGRSAQDADDLVQEAWARLACYEREQVVERPEAFLMRTAINLSIDAHRAQMTRGDEVLAEEVVLVDFAPTAEAVLLAKERLARLSVGISRLSETTRTIFLSHRIDGLPYGEIARVHGLSVTTVHKHVAKATLQLTRWMEDW
ncbi:RNA polymerase sigma factor [Roseateles saccharophilus]|uniref:RNA polymerase sigma-70 factor (ECF subfamily) n=1 Tax=Roseateles saccharophilus TaxID=304 RepID=A0A4R3U679_ROSSA|nr:RNA polymerase sigma factor [Roseateles saccharophilus]MDG0835874.1 RNA polymerase sigma factor [Roseateles saccharophilus]TCU82939.1 RNA polymerase sigma-70 factor (ECF subfamily) [Roseateles saccharophilus]